MKPIIGARYCNRMFFLMRANFIAARGHELGDTIQIELHDKLTTLQKLITLQSRSYQYLHSYHESND